MKVVCKLAELEAQVGSVIVEPAAESGEGKSLAWGAASKDIRRREVEEFGMGHVFQVKSLGESLGEHGTRSTVFFARPKDIEAGTLKSEFKASDARAHAGDCGAVLHSMKLIQFAVSHLAATCPL